jgi:hypothetical protein
VRDSSTPPDAFAHFARKVARENSSKVSVPSWFVSSWSKILRASTSCDVVEPVDGVVPEDVSLEVDPVADVEAGGGVDVDGVAGDCDVAVDGVEADVSDGVDWASVVPAALDGAGAAGSDGVAHATPVIMIATAPAEATVLSKECIATLL